MSEFDPTEFEEAKRGSFLQVLFKAARLANEDSLERLRERTGHDVRATHTALFPHITYEGLRLTELADRVGVTKQAVQQLVDEMEAMGMVERVPDPTDGRAKLIRWSEAGKRGIADGVMMLRGLENRYAERVGEERLRVAHEVLLEVVDLLETEEATKVRDDA